MAQQVALGKRIPFRKGSMHIDYYLAIASVMPILLLAFLWDSGYLRRLRSEKRTLRRLGAPAPGHVPVLFWTKGRVRAYALFVAGMVLCGIAVAVLALGGMVPDVAAVRDTEAGILILELVSLFNRIAVDLVVATRGTTERPTEGPALPRPASGADLSTGRSSGPDGHHPTPLAEENAPETE
jgi:hypothetical protein